MSEELERLAQWAERTDPARDPISPMEVRSAPPVTVSPLVAARPAALGPKRVALAAAVLVLVGIAAVAVQARDGNDERTVLAGEGSTTAASQTTTGSTTPTSTAPGSKAPVADGAARSWLGVGLREAPTFFEGFDYGVRLLRDGQVIAERFLGDFSSDGAVPRTYFTSFEVDPGTVEVESDLNVRGGPPSEPPDFGAACAATIDVPESGGVLLQLDWDTGCLLPLAASSLPGLSSAPTTPTEASPGPAGSDPAPTEPSGSFDGVEEFALFTGRCNFLDHKLDATYVLSDGAKWRFHSTYCGEIDATNRHFGDGEFTFETADGSTLSGTFHSDAQLPSTGEPYTMQIHEGTGAYAGATGECSIDNHLEMIRFGRQRQFGTFTCTIDPGHGSDGADGGASADAGTGDE